MVANCDHLRQLRFSAKLPYAFTEHGALMAANVLNSPRAIHTSVLIVRTFVRLRDLATSNRELARRLGELEQKYDTGFKAVFDAIRSLMNPPAAEAVRRIGFRPEMRAAAAEKGSA